MDEGRKRVIGILAAILAARKRAQLDGTRPSPALNAIIADAVILAERIMQRIDNILSDLAEFDDPVLQVSAGRATATVSVPLGP